MYLNCGSMSNEKGSVIIVALIMLSLLSLIGISATRSSEIEVRVADNQRNHKIAFYSAETARVYVAKTTNLYNSENIQLGQPISFPDKDDSSQKYTISSNQSFNGDVEYTGPTTVPRGSGFEAGKFKAHNYKMECDGYGPSDAGSNVKSGFYRIGF